MSRKPKRARQRAERSDRKNTPEAQAFAAHLLNIGATKAQVKRLLAKKFRGCSPRTAEDIITGARELLIDLTDVAEETHKRHSYAYYMGVITDPKKGDWIKTKCRELLDKLLALPGPVRVEISGGLAHTARVAAGLINDPEVAKLLDALDDKLAARHQEKKPQAPEVNDAHDSSPGGEPTR